MNQCKLDRKGVGSASLWLWLRRWLLLILVIVLSSCTKEPLAEPTDDPATHVFVTMVATESNQLPYGKPTANGRPTSAPATASTQAPRKPSECPALNPNPPVPAKPAAFTDTVSTINEYLDHGASVASLVKQLGLWGNVAQEPVPAEQAGIVTTTRLLSEQDAQVIVIYLENAGVQSNARLGNLVVYQCTSSRYQVLYRADEDPSLFGFVTNPHLLSTVDVTGDGISDLAFSIDDCSTSTCLTGTYVLSEKNGALQNILPGMDWVQSPEYHWQQAKSGPALDLVMKVGYIDSLQAGPQRFVTNTWIYNGSVFTLTSTVKAPPVYRIQALQDGDDAFRHGQYDTAESLYMRAATDLNLQSWQGTVPLRDEPKVLAAFAYMRMMELSAFRKDGASLQAANTALQDMATDDSPGAIYAGLGSVFMAAYNQMQTYQQACQVVIQYAAKHPTTYLLLGSDTYGYANPDYQAADMCPIP